MYHYGLGTPVDNKKAFEYFNKAAAKELVQAEYHMGIHYRDGRWVEKNNDKAAHWFHKAENSGLIKPQLLSESFSMREPEDVQLYVAN